MIDAAEQVMNTNKFWPKPVEIRDKIPEYRTVQEDEFRMKNGQCSICTKKGLVIEEPTGSGKWLCRKCYTGLSNEQISQRMNDLYRIMNGEKHKPEWIKNLQR